MVKELGYNTISLVMEGWEDLRRIKDFERVAGTKLFQRLFDMNPEAKLIFGFSMEADPYAPEVYESPNFVRNASFMIQMFDTAFNMLGPDIELLEEILKDVGKKHAAYGVTSSMFHDMKDCLLHTLEDSLGQRKFNKKMRDAFKETYDTLSAEMIQILEKKK